MTEEKKVTYARRQPGSVIRRKTLSEGNNEFTAENTNNKDNTNNKKDTVDQYTKNVDSINDKDAKRYDKSTFNEDEQLESVLNKVEMDSFLKKSPDYLSQNKSEQARITPEEEKKLMEEVVETVKSADSINSVDSVDLKCDSKDLKDLKYEANVERTEEVSLKEKLAMFNKINTTQANLRKEEVKAALFTEKSKLKPEEDHILQMLRQDPVNINVDALEREMIDFVDAEEEKRKEEEERARQEALAEEERLREAEEQRLREEEEYEEEQARLKAEQEERLKREEEEEENLRKEQARQEALAEEQRLLQLKKATAEKDKLTSINTFINFDFKNYDMLLITDTSSSLRGPRYAKTRKVNKPSAMSSMFSCCGSEAAVDEQIASDILVVASTKDSSSYVEVETANLKVVIE